MSLRINFDSPLEFKPNKFKELNNICGLYFIFLTNRKITYPYKDSKLIYIGMSERYTNSIAKRLASHYNGKSGNFGLQNYRKSDELKFTYINFEIVKSFWSKSIEDFESAFILDFVGKYGVYPICNNKTGFPDLSKELESLLDINWDYFS